MSDLISIIISVYNNETYISKCLESVIMQSYRNLQIIVVDDGSTDRTSEIVQSYANKDKRIEVYQLPHGGVCRARKFAVKRAKGTYIGFADSDDWMEGDYYEKLYIGMRDDMDLTACGYTKENGGISVKYLEKCKCRTYTAENIDSFYSVMLNPAQSISAMLWNKLMKAGLLKEVMDEVDETLCMGSDAVMAYTYMLKCKCIRVIDECGYHYTFNPASLTESSDDSFLLNVNNFYQNMLRNIQGHKCESAISDNIKRYIVALLRNRINYKLKLPEDAKVLMYYYPWYGRLEGKRVILYGAGEVGREFYRCMLRDKECQVILWCDQQYETIGLINNKQKVQSVERIRDYTYDYIVIAVKDKEMAQTIKQNLIDVYHVDSEKILWNKTKSIWE